MSGPLEAPNKSAQAERMTDGARILIGRTAALAAIAVVGSRRGPKDE